MGVFVDMDVAYVVSSKIPRRTRHNKTEPQIKIEARRILKLPMGEPEWSQTGPQSEHDVSMIFAHLTMQDIPIDKRRSMGCIRLLKTLARRIDSTCDLQFIAFTGALQVAIDRGFISPAISAKIMAPMGVKGSLIQVKRAAAVRYGMISDLMHHHGVLGLRTYEMLIRRNTRALNMLGAFSPLHFEALTDALDERDHEIYKPQRQLNSTYIRIPNIVHTLFAGTCSRLEVEGTFRLNDWPLENSHVPDEIDLVTLDCTYEYVRQAVCTEIVALTPTLREGGLEGCGALGLWEGFHGFTERHASVFRMVAQCHDMEIVDWVPENRPPRVFSLYAASYTRAPTGFMAFAILLCNRTLEITREPRRGEEDGQMDGGYEEAEVVRWSPGKVLCLLEQGVKAKDECNEAFFLLNLVKVQPF